MRSFMTTWFSIHIPVWEKALAGLKGKPNLNFLEIGCFEGRSTCWLMENILTDKTSKITCIDIFRGVPESGLVNYEGETVKNRFLENTKEFREKITLLENMSRKVLPTLPEGSFDFIYVDGSHTMADCIIDGFLSWYLLKKGGIMIFDDLNYGEGLHSWERPHEAINAFLTAHMPEINIFTNPVGPSEPTAQVILRKR